MAAKFRRGATVYDKQGRAFTVHDVEDGMVYCAAENGVETEFPEAALVSETEWQTRHTRPDSKQAAPSGDRLYDRVRASRLYLGATAGLDHAASREVLAKMERLLPGILDFAAIVTAERALDAAGDSAQADLSTAKCRAIFDAAKPETRATLVAGLFNTKPDIFVGAARLGDNLWRAMLEKFTDAHGAEFDQFKGAKRR